MSSVLRFLIEGLVALLLSAGGATAPHLVGDSTAHRATLEIGYGSGHPGHGFVSSVHGLIGGGEPFLNPLHPPPDPDIPVVGFVSIWDAGRRDLHGYVEATQTYPGGVIWVAVPPFRDLDRTADPRLEALNAGVAAAIGCDLVPWEWRDVDTTDGVHPSPAGVVALTERMTALAEIAEPCRIAGSAPSPGEAP